jgi:hypothetical protein
MDIRNLPRNSAETIYVLADQAGDSRIAACIPAGFDGSNRDDYF